jgi:hypothetical protein
VIGLFKQMLTREVHLLSVFLLRKRALMYLVQVKSLASADLNQHEQPTLLQDVVEACRVFFCKLRHDYLLFLNFKKALRQEQRLSCSVDFCQLGLDLQTERRIFAILNPFAIFIFKIK